MFFPSGCAQMQFPDAESVPARVRFSHSRVAAGAPFEPLGEASLAPEGGGGPAARLAAPQLHHVFQLGRDVPVVHQFLRAVLADHLMPARAAGVLSGCLLNDSGPDDRCVWKGGGGGAAQMLWFKLQPVVPSLLLCRLDRPRGGGGGLFQHSLSALAPHIPPCSPAKLLPTTFSG